MNNRKRFVSSLALAAALAAAGCGGGGGDQMYAPTVPTPTPPTSTPVAESFTNWSKTGVFAQPENAAPIAMDTLVFSFDGDENPNAYAELLPPT